MSPSLSELSAIYSESDDQKSDSWAVNEYVFMLHDRPPYNRFVCGNQLTLPQESSIEIIEELEKFYEKKFSSHLMKMVVVTNSPLDDIKAKIIEHFSKIKKQKLEPFNWPVGVNTGQMIKYFSKDRMFLTLSIPIEIEETYPEELKIYDFFSHLLAINTPGSFYYDLANKGYIRSGRSYFYQLKNFGKINVILVLHEMGRKNLDEILSMFIQWVEFLAEGGRNLKLLYEEYNSKCKIQAFSQQLDEEYVGELSEQMQKINIEEMLSNKVQYDDEKVKYYFSKIKVRDMASSKPSWNFNVTLGIDAQNLDPKLDKFEKGDVYFQVEYSSSPLNFTYTSTDFGFTYPLSNPFSFNGELKSNFDGNQSVSVRAIEQCPGFWIKSDFPIKSDQITINLLLGFEYLDLKSRQLMKIFFSVVFNQLSLSIDRANDAGYSAYL